MINQTFTFFCCYLAAKAKNRFEQVELPSFTVGHTHNEMNQRFSSIATLLSRQPTVQDPDDFQKCVEENKKPVSKIKNLVKQIYDPFSDEQISSKISSMLKEKDINSDVEVIYQSIKNLHIACPDDLGDWYFSGNYPTPGGNKVVNQAFINYYEGSNKRAY